MSAIEFLRDIGKHFSVNRMLDREAVAARLASTGISYTEFSYQLLQSNDYLELFRRHDCTLQIGGSDQWGNITAGVDLIRRVTGEHAHALTTPLLDKSDGKKFGKSEGGAVWLDPALTTPYAFYQFWINTEDAMVPSLLRRVTFRGREEITRARGRHRRASAPSGGAASPCRRRDHVGARRRADRRCAGGECCAVRQGRAGLARRGNARRGPARGAARDRPRRRAAAGGRPAGGAPSCRPASRRPGGRSTRGAPTSTTCGSPTPNGAQALTTWCMGGGSSSGAGKRAIAGVEVV